MGTEADELSWVILSHKNSNPGVNSLPTPQQSKEPQSAAFPLGRQVPLPQESGMKIPWPGVRQGSCT